MAVKFSQFTTGSSLADLDYFVGYKGTDNIQVAKALVTGTTYTVDVPAATTNINLAGSDSTNDAITLTGGTDISLVRTSASEITINSSAPAGETYDLNATADGSDVDLNLTSTSGTDNSTVQFTAGSAITLTRTGAQEITFALTDDSVTVAKLANEFKTAYAIASAASMTIDCDTYDVWTWTAAHSATLDFTDVTLGMTKTLQITGSGGALTIAFQNINGSAGTFNKTSGTYSDAAVKNLIQLKFISTSEAWYTISQIT